MRVNILAFVVGVWLLQQQAVLPGLAWWLVLPLIIISGGLCRPLALRRALFAVAWAGAGFMWAASFAQFRLADELPPQWQGRDIRLVGVVAALPSVNERGQRFEFDVEQVLTPDAVAPRHIQLTWYADDFGRKLPVPPPQVHAGERWQLTVRLRRPHGNANPHGFDFEAWALERNLRAIGHVRIAEDNRRMTERVYRPSYLVEMAREAVARRFQAVLGDAPYAGVLKALAVGDQNAISQAQWQVFSRTGVTHLMSISGSHVTMLSGLVFALVLGLWRRSPALALRLAARKAAALAGVLAALGYVWLSGYGVPAQRTLYMLTVVATALWLGRAGCASRVLCLALLAVLLLDPWAVLAPGFWLSFGAVGVIFYISVGRMQRPHWLRAWGLTQWAVTLSLVPALLLLFQQVSLISPLANAFAIPVIGLLVTPLTLLGALLPLDFVLLAAHRLMAWCMAALEAMSRLPDAVWQQHVPPLWTVAASLLGIAWMLLPRGFPARWLGLAGMAPLFLVLPPQPPEGALWLSVLDVGQGLAVVAQTRRHALLFDTGPRYSGEADSGNRIVVPFLRAAGIARLDGMIVSHNDSDHSGGAISVLQALSVDWLASSLTRDNAILAQTRRVLPCYVGQSWTWDGVRFDMLHPALDIYRDERVKSNDRSCVLKITSRYGSALLPADAELRSEREMLARNPDLLPSTVLVAGHHGSKSSSSEEFIAQVNPKTVVFTAGYRNRYGHPRPEIVERFRRLGATLQRSDADGALLFRFEADSGVRVQAWREVEPRYWRSRH
ncbi:MAG: DNA internalization-related competence protein ComEC/Rec2 [Sulfuricellaceae bacterium]